MRGDARHAPTTFASRCGCKGKLNEEFELAFRPHTLRIVAAIIVVLLLATAVWVTSAHWWPNDWLERSADESADNNATGHNHAHEREGHDRSAHLRENSIELSENGLKNIGYWPVTVALGTFERTITIPAIVVEQAGRTQIHITSPVTGVVTEITAFNGEAVEPDSLMFEVRLTHEEVVTTQRDYLLTSESLDVVNREIERLQSVGQGVIPGKVVLEKQYEKQKLEAALLASEQALMLHGLSANQIAEIRSTKQLIQTLTIRPPIIRTTTAIARMTIYSMPSGSQYLRGSKSRRAKSSACSPIIASC